MKQRKPKLIADFSDCKPILDADNMQMLSQEFELEDVDAADGSIR